MPSYQFTETSETELDDIWTYLYLNASETIADRQVARLKDSFRLLAHHPDMGRSRENYGPGIRRHNISGTPYYVLYILVTDGIEIVRIIHGSRDISGAFW
jgi:toxin ParE1/3/4